MHARLSDEAPRSPRPEAVEDSGAPRRRDPVAERDARRKARAVHRGPQAGGHRVRDQVLRVVTKDLGSDKTLRGGFFCAPGAGSPRSGRSRSPSYSGLL